MMKVVAISSSPLMGKGNTDLILTPFLDGLKQGGAVVELFYIHKLNIKPCLGNICCWVKTPGVCVQDDDMQKILPHLREADIWVLATPLYMDGMTATLKMLIDRLSPLALPFMGLHKGHNCHLVREKTLQDGKVVLLSNCGFWELDNFDPLVLFMEAFCRNMQRTFAGGLLRPHGPALRFVKNETRNDVFAAAKSAGIELAQSGRISAQVVQAVSRPLLSRDEYIEHINKGFEKILNARGL